MLQRSAFTPGLIGSNSPLFLILAVVPPMLRIVPPGGAPRPAPSADAVGCLDHFSPIERLGKATVLLQGVDLNPPCPGVKFLAPGDRVGPEPDRIEQLDVPPTTFDGLHLDRCGGRRPGLPGLLAGLVAVGGCLRGSRQGHHRQACHLEQVTRPAPRSRYGITERIGQPSCAVMPQDQIALGAADLAGATVDLEVSVAPACRAARQGHLGAQWELCDMYRRLAVNRYTPN